MAKQCFKTCCGFDLRTGCIVIAYFNIGKCLLLSGSLMYLLVIDKKPKAVFVQCMFVAGLIKFELLGSGIFLMGIHRSKISKCLYHLHRCLIWTPTAGVLSLGIFIAYLCLDVKIMNIMIALVSSVWQFYTAVMFYSMYRKMKWIVILWTVLIRARLAELEAARNTSDPAVTSDAAIELELDNIFANQLPYPPPPSYTETYTPPTLTSVTSAI